MKHNKQQQVFATSSARETQLLGAVLAKEVLRTAPGRKAVVFALRGELGSGKTTFTQGFAKGLGVQENVLSPTFVILTRFKIQNSKFQSFYHIDCYRLGKPKELADLGWEEIVSDPRHIVLVEWADRVQNVIPKDAVWAAFSSGKEDKREIRMLRK